MIHIICSCDQSLVTLAFLWKKLSQPQFYKDLTRKTAFFEGWSWFKFNNLGWALGTSLKFYTSATKGLKLKVRKFWGLLPTFVEITGEKLVGGLFAPLPPSWTGLNLCCIIISSTYVQRKHIFDNFMISLQDKTENSLWHSSQLKSNSHLPKRFTLFASLKPL